MKWIVVALVVIAVLVAVVTLIGSRLPKSHRALVEHTFSAAPETVSAPTDPGAQP